jgi:microcystin-dependent protein
MADSYPALGDFLNHEGDTFTLSRETDSDDDSEMALRLLRVDTSRDRDDDHERFSLVFTSTGERRPESAMYDVSHAELGEFPVTVTAVASSDGEGGPTHEAVFDRPKSVVEGDVQTDGGTTSRSEVAAAGSPLIGEIRTFGFTYAPQGWAPCHGQPMPIQQHHALFALLGTTYGGNGRSTFGLPDLEDRFPMGRGSSHRLGNRGGQTEVTLSEAQMPTHNHQSDVSVPASSDSGDATSPVGNALAKIEGSSFSNLDAYASGSVSDSMPTEGGTEDAGGSNSHPNVPPFLSLNYSIALTGTYPPRS